MSGHAGVEPAPGRPVPRAELELLTEAERDAVVSTVELVFAGDLQAFDRLDDDLQAIARALFYERLAGLGIRLIRRPTLSLQPYSTAMRRG